jgi:hypothetical protein
MKKNIVIVIVSIVLVITSVLWLLIFHESASTFLTRTLLNYGFKPESLTMRTVIGSLAAGQTYTDIELQNSAWFDIPNSLKIHTMGIAVGLQRPWFSIVIDNGRLKLPSTDTVLFSGRCDRRGIDAQVYCPVLDVDEMLSLFNLSDLLMKNSIKVREIDFDITGDLTAPHFEGVFSIEEIINENISVQNMPATFSLTARSDYLRFKKLYGEVIFSSGQIMIRKTALTLQKSRIIYNGDMSKPQLDFNAVTTVEGLPIKIALKGTFEKPELRLSSQPEKTETLLLIMIVTGKRWQGAEPSLEQARISPDLALDLFDLLFLGSSFSAFKKKAGISEFHIDSTEEQRSLRIKKELPLQTEVGYAVEQKKDDEKKIRQKVGAEYAITDEVSIEGQTEIRSADTKETDREDTIMLKFKKNF